MSLNEEEQQPTNPFIELSEWANFFDILLTVALIVSGFTIALQRSKNAIIAQIELLTKNQDHKFSRLLDSELNNCLNKLQALSGCDRVLIGQFHNGEYYRSGQSRTRFSITNEALSNPSISSIQGQLQDIPASKLASELSSLSQSKGKMVYAHVPSENLVVNNENIAMSDSYRNHLLSIGVFYCYEILLSESEELGMLFFQYTQTNHEGIKRFEANRKQILDLVHYIEALLSGTF